MDMNNAGTKTKGGTFSKKKFKFNQQTDSYMKKMNQYFSEGMYFGLFSGQTNMYCIFC